MGERNQKNQKSGSKKKTRAPKDESRDPKDENRDSKNETRKPKDENRDSENKTTDSKDQTTDSGSERKTKKARKKHGLRILNLKMILILLVVIAVVAAGLTVKHFSKAKDTTTIITESTLYKIINVSELSTYQCVYNDICTIMDEEEPEDVAYYCAYDAKVNAGIDFEKVEIQVDEEIRKITVTIPKVTITDVNVDISSLDYMFEMNSANTGTVSEKAYKACIEDVTKKSEAESKIYDLAEQNAENIIKALIQPFVEQLDEEYVLEIKVAEGQ